ncbi:hypothetical protein HWQ46_03100 [Shewanella sp. D64]|uniref:hypothetical protein n=1 Tax=unclassified Shewanella TaxID=196818 RepID=UPI0022BA4E69|nr:MULTISPECIES: hypothetical protein [unclassified Shewanella]MEC4724534.1 hypothetical protein [Shewanella sp. D64]MEC4736689.1 hypothetical protein [Shewanella sp. E94]WBJ94641.1 hypothetical protein HWQ47_22740 [Shewanella sp. MTB7]
MSWFDDFDLGKTISAIAPLAGKIIGGPFAALGISAIQLALGSDETEPEALAKQIKNATPEQLIALRNIDAGLKVQLKELNIKEQDLEYQDRANARELFKQNSWPQVLLSALFVLGYFTITGLLAYYAVNWQEGIEINPLLFGMLGTVIGVLTAAIPQILNFWFGSSKSSQEKNQLLTNGMK